ncbi:hypothetical protein PILCRDRAFT_202603 [Piloderma croceum F 1598]|uniref:Uncharacterized protein n=1 Tax=Piloderma croceum (strain F 1598) TaxID=765440 RepID=A0A0C3CJP3_PILCF|nr:hypothetical protein PILCRDRAFT_202603 [Piloderma croceum F 1598]
MARWFLQTTPQHRHIAPRCYCLYSVFLRSIPRMLTEAYCPLPPSRHHESQASKSICNFKCRFKFKTFLINAVRLLRPRPLRLRVFYMCSPLWIYLAKPSIQGIRYICH